MCKMKKPDYKKIYKQHHSSPAEIKKRASRNAARLKMMKMGKVSKGDGMHVDHTNRNPLDNRAVNLRVMTQRANLTRKKK